MPKAAAYRLTWSPARGVYELCENQSKQVLPVVPGSHEWFTWLTVVPSFTFSGQAGQLTVRQEARPRGGRYWYASRRTGKKMAKRYLGHTTEVTPARLEEEAAQLAEAAPGTIQATLVKATSSHERPDQHGMPTPTTPSPGGMTAQTRPSAVP